MKKSSLLSLLTTMALLVALVTGCGAPAAESTPPASDSTPTQSAEQTDTQAADLVLKNGEIQTLATDDQVAQALAVKDGVITFVGSDADVEAYIGADTQVIDLEGGYVTPGFIDAHTHDVQAIVVQMFQCYLTETEPTVEAYQAALKEFAEANPDMEVITGGSLNLNAFENGIPTAQWIDEVVSDRPVMLSDASLHGRCLNTKAMELLGVTKDTPDPAGGVIYRDAEGNPTGYFSDCQDLVAPLEGDGYSAEQYTEAFLVYQQHANELGITGINLGGNEIAQPDQWEALKALEESGQLNLRVNAIVWAGGESGAYNADTAAADVALLDQAQDMNSDFLRISQVKVKLDGVPEGKSAVLLEPYAEGAGMGDDFYGTLNGDPEGINAYVTAVNAAGYQVQIHAMGDGAVHAALDAYEQSLEANGPADYRNIITHVTLITDEDKQRMGEMDVIAAMQPMWFYYDPMFSPLEEQNFGSERFATEYLVRDMMDAGIMITGSADYPITEDNPLDAMEAGVTQCSPFSGEEDDEAFLRNPDQGATPLEALKWYTTNGAYQMKMEDLIGTIEVGKKADLTVLGANILTCDAKEINEAGVRYTISDGRIVYQNN